MGMIAGLVHISTVEYLLGFDHLSGVMVKGEGVMVMQEGSWLCS